MFYDYFLEINEDDQVIGSHKMARISEETSEEFLNRVLDVLQPESGTTVVHVDDDRYYRFLEAPDYLPDDIIDSMENRGNPSAYWDHEKKDVYFIPFLRLKVVDGCEFIENGRYVSSIIGDAPGIYKVTGSYPVIRFTIESVCHPGEKDSAPKEDIDANDFDISISTGNTVPLPNKTIHAHVTHRKGSENVAITVPNPKTNLMLVEINHKKALLGTYSFYFVWNEN